MVKGKQANVKEMNRHWRMLCKTIGHRYSGTKGEQRAADYIEGQYRKYGLTNVRQHRFEFPNCDYSRCVVRVGRGRKMRRISTASAMNFTVSTRPGGVKGELVYLQGGSELDFRQPTKGKIGLMVGSLGLGDPAVKDRFVRSKLAGLIAVDSRVPFGWKIPLGAAPQWVEGYRVPTACIPYLEAARIMRELPLQAEVEIQARAFPAASQNVIGQVQGTGNEVIVVSGHHDCVQGNVGADDNGSGVIFTLELARRFAGRRLRRTLRFVTYGVEEKLSVGAYLYMRSLSRKEQRRCVFALNADSGASAMGEDGALVTGTTALERVVRRHWERRRHPVNISQGVNVYSDHFPLNICGVPSVWLSRPSMLGGAYWTLHSVHDNLENVDAGVLARTVDTAGAFLEEAATAKRLPFPRKIDAKVMKEVRSEAKARYHHPWSPDDFDYRPYQV